QAAVVGVGDLAELLPLGAQAVGLVAAAQREDAAEAGGARAQLVRTGDVLRCAPRRRSGIRRVAAQVRDNRHAAERPADRALRPRRGEADEVLAAAVHAADRAGQLVRRALLPRVQAK